MTVQNFKKYEMMGAYHWNEMVPALRISFNPYLQARYKLALAEIPSDGGTLVDFGCGDGFVAAQASERGYEVFGIDGSQEAIALAKKAATKSKVTFMVGDVTKTQLPENTADVIVSLDVIEHLDNPTEMLKEMRRVAKPNALILIGTPIRFTEFPLDKYHVKEFFADEYVHFLSDFFKVERNVKSHPLEMLALMQRKFRFFGREKNLGWNLINLYCFLTGKNPLMNTSCKFPTYQLAVCRNQK